MKTTYNDPQVKLNTNRRGKTDYDIVVYGTRSLRKQLDDTVAAAIRRYMEEKEIGTRKLSRLTGIPKGTISRYRNGTAKYDPDYLCAICIALRLQTCRQRHLFRMLNWKMPDECGRKRNRAYIIREFLDGCPLLSRTIAETLSGVSVHRKLPMVLHTHLLVLNDG